jgi:hypothetical protein
MRRRTRAQARAAAITLAAIAFQGQPAAAQAFTPAKGLGAVTLAWQYIDNTGHLLTDGYFVARGQSVGQSVLLDAEYAVTDRLAVTAGIPYVFGKYTGSLPPLSGTARDACQCWTSGFQDFAFGVRHRFGNGSWAITPLARYGQPSHDYPFTGEAAIGRNLTQLQLGVATGVRLPGWASRANLQASYSYAFVEKAIDDISVNRSNASGEIGYSAGSRLYLRAAVLWQRTHGGLRLGSDTGNPFPLPGEVNTPERRAVANQARRVNYWHIAGGLALNAGPIDVFASYVWFVAGTDTHAGHAFAVGTSWYFDTSN